ncbi:RHS repeat-associated core domain-containing protein [Embleya sp. AB8]|uniref:RHS repeat-associated core domain-containing protein n=1 Tax=Embleya sp. AB8 TaxID=3156304 RepID=UPI003C791C53
MPFILRGHCVGSALSAKIGDLFRLRVSSLCPRFLGEFRVFGLGWSMRRRGLRGFVEGGAREINRPARTLSVSVAALLLTGTLTPTQAYATRTPSRANVDLPELQKEKPVPGADSAAQFKLPAAPGTQVEYTPTKTTPPDGGSGQIVIGGAQSSLARTVQGADGSRMRQAGSLPIWLGPAGGTSPTTVGKSSAALTDVAATGTWTVTVSTRAATEAAGIDGVLMKLDPSPDATPATLKLNYDAFEQLYGAGWGSRLKLVQLPECFLTTPDAPGCTEQVDLGSVNNGATNDVTATITPPATASPPQGAAAVAASASGGSMVVAATGGKSGDAGDYQATSLQPSGKWTAGGSAGGFSWQYGIDVPPVAAGPKPTVALTYSSQSVDGRTSATNNQASWVGDGWDYQPGFIERSYRSCKGDKTNGNNTKDTGDLCWGSDNAVISLNGSSVALVKDNTTGAWKPASDDNTRVEHKFGATNGDDNGEYWVVTTPDGTKYHFGLNRLPGWTTGKATTDSVFTVPVFGNQPGEPCHQNSYADSACDQAWRWNLDYVEDTHANAMALYWKQERNWYAKNAKTDQPKSYVRGGWLDRIEYGLRADTVYSRPAPAKVSFVVGERCLVTESFDCAESRFTKYSTDALHWPDTPVDALCKDTGKCYAAGPTFWTRKWLTTILAEVAKTPGSGEYRRVDEFELKHNFLSTRYDTNPPAWLDSIRRIGYAPDGTTASLPPVTFHANAVDMPNRQSKPGEARPPFNRLRVERVFTETGGGIAVKYSAPDPVCNPDATKPKPEENTSRCYPVFWSPDSADESKIEWFNKYVVIQVDEEDFVAGAPARSSRYEYLDGAAWAKDDNEFTKPSERSWNEWRGYERVVSRIGRTDPAEGTVTSKTETHYFRGMHDDPTKTGKRTVEIKDSTGARVADDLRAYQGMTAETISYLGDGQGIGSRTVNKPWSRVTATHDRSDDLPHLQSVQTAMESSETVQPISGGRTRTTRNRTVEFDPTYPLPIRVESTGDTAVGSDEHCSVTSYLHNTELNLIGVANATRDTAGSCAQADNAGPERVLAMTRKAFDGLAQGAVPVRGDITRTEITKADGTGTVEISRTEYDPLGRPTRTFNPFNQPTTTEYTPAAGGAAPSRTVVTNALGHTTSTEFDTGRGLASSKTDANGRVTKTAYDGLGRLAKVWLPERATGEQAPGLEYTYDVSGSRPSVITSRTLRDDGTYAIGKTLYDGLLRSRQTQNEAVGPGRIVTDTFYNASGSVRRENAKYLTAGTPSDQLYVALSNTQIPAWNETAYDGLSRPTMISAWNAGTRAFESRREYGGDYVLEIPPPGGIAERVWSDALGRVVKRDQFTDAGRTAFTETKYEYDARGNASKMTDAAGNQWRYTYDARARLIEVDDPDKGKSAYTYDEAGREIGSTDARGVTRSRTWDVLDRPTSVRNGGPDGPVATEWAYDGPGAKGMLRQSTEYSGGRAYVEEITGYDQAYRITGRTIRIPAAEGALAGDYRYSYAYSATGALTETTVPAIGRLPEENVVVRYNRAGLPVSTSGSAWYTSDVVYNPFGEVLRSVSGSAPTRVWTTNFYDEFTGRLVRSANHAETAPYALNDTSYTFDVSGNVTSIKDRSPNAAGTTITDTQCFSYDARRLLSKAWTATDGCASAPRTGTGGTVGGPDAYSRSYAYDAVGNRTSEQQQDPGGDSTKDIGRSYAFEAAGTGSTHALTSVTQTGAGAGVRTFGRDPSGNMTSRQFEGRNQTLTWGMDARLAKVEDSTAGPTEFVYGADGERLLRRTPKGTTLFLGETEVTLAPNGTLSARRSYTQAGVPTVVRNSGTPNRLSAVLADHHGTGLTSVDLAPGMAVQRRRTTPFGETRGPAPVNWPTTKGFVDGDVDDTTGLVHLGAREYDPTTGRFISVDPVIDTGNPLQIHPYLYGYNNPLTFSDPSGLLGMPKWAKKTIKTVKNATPIVHTVLDVAGMVPVVGEAADLANAGIYAAEGDWANAAISAVGALPVAGNAATAYRTTQHAVDASATVAKKGGSKNVPKFEKGKSPGRPLKSPKPEKMTDAKRKDLQRPDDGWINLYHATTVPALENILQNGIVVDYSKRHADFGVAFYVTNDINQAIDWAKRASGEGSGQGVILHFRVPKDFLSQYNGKTFYWANNEWEEMIRKHRTAKNPPGVYHNYDYVEGPILRGKTDVDNYPGPYSSSGHQIGISAARMGAALGAYLVGIYFL